MFVQVREAGTTAVCVREDLLNGVPVIDIQNLTFIELLEQVISQHGLSKPVESWQFRSVYVLPDCSETHLFMFPVFSDGHLNASETVTFVRANWARTLSTLRFFLDVSYPVAATSAALQPDALGAIFLSYTI